MSNKVENCEIIARYLVMELMKMGYRIECNRSKKSKDSWYIKICTGTWNKPKSTHIRISDHNASPRYNTVSKYDFDISVSHLRKNAITFIDFFALFASRQKKPVPREIDKLMYISRYGVCA